MMSFNSLIHLFSSELKSYIDNNQTISNGKFKQEDIDKWRIWHPCPIKPEFWHDNMLNYISFDVSFVDSKPILSMHFIVDDLIIILFNCVTILFNLVILSYFIRGCFQKPPHPQPVRHELTV